MVAKKRAALELADDERLELSVVSRSRTEPHGRVERARMLRGFPAFAGIDPRGPATSPPRRWLPRVRGDRPSTAARAQRSTPASPRSRG